MSGDDSQHRFFERKKNGKSPAATSFTGNLYSCKFSAQASKRMIANSSAKGEAHAREASLSPPPLKKRKLESTTTSKWIDVRNNEVY